MSGHVLPVLFSWHLGIALNEVAGAAKARSTRRNSGMPGRAARR
jgi:hypothetical protein